MSDAQAAQVTENGVPPTTQEETPGFKVCLYPFFSKPPTTSSFLQRFSLATLRIPPRMKG